MADGACVCKKRKVVFREEQERVAGFGHTGKSGKSARTDHQYYCRNEGAKEDFGFFTGNHFLPCTADVIWGVCMCLMDEKGNADKGFERNLICTEE